MLIEVQWRVGDTKARALNLFVPRKSAGVSIRAAGWLAVIVRKDDVQGHADLVQIVHALNPLCFALCLYKCREQESCENRDDGEHHEELDKGECGDLAHLRRIAHRIDHSV